MERPTLCPSCRKPLAADAPHGLCPECLVKSGFPTGAGPPAGEPTSRITFVPPPITELAKLFPQLEIVEFLGQGGMGAVYKARQSSLDRWVALKILPAQLTTRAGFAERFNREARALARLSHPGIVAVHEFGEAGGMPYFVMEYVDGMTLRQLLSQGWLSTAAALQIVPAICDALQYAHEEGVMHRDIKPENILVDKKGRVKIADFGIAKIADDGPPASGLTQANELVGSPSYMAPEQMEKPGNVDHRADIYALGVVFYELLTGELPLGRFPPPSQKVQIDVRLDEVVLRALQKEPALRFQQARGMKTEVETIASSPRPAPGDRRRAVRFRRARPWLIAGAVALLAAVIACGWFVITPCRVQVDPSGPDLPNHGWVLVNRRDRQIPFSDCDVFVYRRDGKNILARVDERPDAQGRGRNIDRNWVSYVPAEQRSGPPIPIAASEILGKVVLDRALGTSAASADFHCRVLMIDFDLLQKSRPFIPGPEHPESGQWFTSDQVRQVQACAVPGTGLWLDEHRRVDSRGPSANSWASTTVVQPPPSVASQSESISFTIGNQGFLGVWQKGGILHADIACNIHLAPYQLNYEGSFSEWGRVPAHESHVFFMHAGFETTGPKSWAKRYGFAIIYDITGG